MAVFRIEKTRDYTVMSNHHLKDRTLTLKSKGLLSMMLSLPDEWNYTTRGLAAICREGVDSIGAALKELENHGYIRRTQLRDEKGKITDTEYVIYEMPQCEPPSSPGTPLPGTAKPYTENPDMGIPDTAEPCTENPAQLNTNQTKTDLSSTELSNPNAGLTCLFKDTLLNNIKAARPDATREEVLKAADEAQCKDIIDRLPDGLDTLVGTGGTYLSGGENQRIALARAILKDAPIIVLDEATAFADAENEHQIQLAFERLTQNKTVMMIAHRLSTIQDADLILVFKEGQIAERGTHEELVALNGIYSSMWKDYQTSIAWKVGKEDEQHD